MKRILPLLLILAGAIAPALAQSGTQADPLPLARGVNTPDFTAANSVFYTYTPATDEMLEFSNLSNVVIYTYQITPPTSATATLSTRLSTSRRAPESNIPSKSRKATQAPIRNSPSTATPHHGPTAAAWTPP